MNLSDELCTIFFLSEKRFLFLFFTVREDVVVNDNIFQQYVYRIGWLVAIKLSIYGC